jgi:hypothetical protein
VLSAVEFDVVWEALGLGPTPVVLNLASPGRTHTERRHIVAATWADLRPRGLAGPRGPEPGLVRLLRLLAAPGFRMEVRAWGAAPARALVAGRPGDGVCARRDGETVVLDSRASLPGAVVGVLTPAVAGPGRAANVPTAALGAAVTSPSGAGLRADLRERGVPPDEAGLVARMLRGIHTRTEVSTVAVDRWGLRSRSADVLGVLDGPRGRYLVTRDGAWTTVAPVDTRRLRHRVAELLDAAGPPGDQSRSPWRMSCRPDSVIEPDRDG